MTQQTAFNRSAGVLDFGNNARTHQSTGSAHTFSLRALALVLLFLAPSLLFAQVGGTAKAARADTGIFTYIVKIGSDTAATLADVRTYSGSGTPTGDVEGVVVVSPLEGGGTGGTVTITFDTTTAFSYMKYQYGLLAPLASPTFTGTVTLPSGLTGTVRVASGVVSATASDTVGLGTSLSGKLSFADSTALLAYVKSLITAGNADSTVFATRYYTGATYAPKASPTITGNPTLAGASTLKLFTGAGTLRSASDGYVSSTASDTVGLAAALALKLAAADTASLSSRINLKLTATDTASLSSRINLKLTATDTASLSSRINLKLTATDTASLSSRIDLKLDKSDSTIYLTPSDGRELIADSLSGISAGTRALATPALGAATGTSLHTTGDVSAGTDTLGNKMEKSAFADSNAAHSVGVGTLTLGEVLVVAGTDSIRSRDSIQVRTAVIDSGDVLFTGGGTYGFRWPGGGRLYEQNGGGAADRLLFQPNGGLLQILTEDGNTYIASFSSGETKLYYGGSPKIQMSSAGTRIINMLHTIAAGDSVFGNTFIRSTDSCMVTWNGSAWITIQDLTP